MYVHAYTGLMSRCVMLAQAYYLLEKFGGAEETTSYYLANR